MNTPHGLFKYLPSHIMRAMVSLDESVLAQVTEVRLRSGQRACVTFRGRTVALEATCTQSDIDYAVERMCGFSRYSAEESLRSGYITLEDGSRVGVCGEAVCEGGKIKTLVTISSVNIRLRRTVPMYAAKLVAFYGAGGPRGTLVISPPMFGKTTLLSSAAALLGGRGVRVAVADERGELVMGNVLGVDVLSGCPKPLAIEMLTRTMAPQVIVCDELSHTESSAVLQAQSAGVALIASLHADSVENAMRRPFARELVDAGVFEIACVIGQNYEYGMTELKKC